MIPIEYFTLSLIAFSHKATFALICYECKETQQCLNSEEWGMVRKECILGSCLTVELYEGRMVNITRTCGDQELCEAYKHVQSIAFTKTVKCHLCRYDLCNADSFGFKERTVTASGSVDGSAVMNSTEIPEGSSREKATRCLDFASTTVFFEGRGLTNGKAKCKVYNVAIYKLYIAFRFLNPFGRGEW